MIIYKYTLSVDDNSTELHLPGFQIARVEHASAGRPDLLPNGQVNMWVVLDRAPQRDDPTHEFRVVGTGMPVTSDIWEWVGTTPPENHSLLVWHVLHRVRG